MQILLFLLFIAVPIAEIALFIEAGRLIGLVPTILITIGTAIAGSILMRVQGFTTLTRVSESVSRGEMPLMPVVDGIGILAAGLLLLTPGLLTDAIGLLLFVPPIRRGLAKWIFSRMVSSGRVRFSGYGKASGGAAKPAPPAAEKFEKSPNVVDAEFETIDPDENDDDAARAKRHNGKPGPRGANSPWRRG